MLMLIMLRKQGVKKECRLKVKYILHYLKKHKLVSERLDHVTTFWSEFNYLARRKFKITAIELIDLTVLCLETLGRRDCSYLRFAEQLEKFVGRKKFSRMLKLYCNLTSLYNHNLDESERIQVNQQFLAIRKYINSLADKSPQEEINNDELKGDCTISPMKQEHRAKVSRRLNLKAVQGGRIHEPRKYSIRLGAVRSCRGKNLEKTDGKQLLNNI